MNVTGSCKSRDNMIIFDGPSRLCPIYDRRMRAGAWQLNPFAEQGAFAPEATAAMGEAFDASCEELRDVGPSSTGAQAPSPTNCRGGTQR